MASNQSDEMSHLEGPMIEMKKIDSIRSLTDQK